MVIGNGTVFFGRVHVDLTRPCLVEIGQNCVITNNVTLLSHGFDWAVLREKYHEVLCSSGRIVIEDNVFVGANTTILKGVIIGRNSIIGAGSVVTHDIPADSVAAGNPCEIIMSLEQYYRSRKSKYVTEAKSYAYQLYRRTGRIPKPEDFWEEFPIFLKRDGNWGRLPVESQLGSAFANFLKSKPVYFSFKEFLIDAGLPKKEIEKEMKLTAK